MQEVESRFRKNGICHHLEHTGSSYDGSKIRSGNETDALEFDVAVVIDRHKNELQPLDDNSRPGYAWLKLNRSKQASPELNKFLKYWNFLRYFFGGDLYVDPQKTIDIVFNELQKVINGSAPMNGRVMLRRHGLAVRMDVYPQSGMLLWGPLLYSADLVPAFQVDGVLYVSKPLKEETPNRMTWRGAVSVKEREDLSEGAKCVLQALLSVRNRQPGLEPLTSYHLKTALFYEMDEEDDFNDHALVLRFLSILRRLETSLTFGNLPHYFYRETNLLSSMSSSSLINMRDKIKRIRSSEHELMDILKS